MKVKILNGLIILFSLLNISLSQEWINHYNSGGNSDDRGYGIVTDGAGNIYTSGYSSNDTSGIDITLLKYDNAGHFQWFSKYPGIGNNTDKPLGIVVDSDGNVYITGYTTKPGGNIDFVTLKFNTDGTQIWSKTYNGTGNGEDKAWGIVVDNSGNVYITGTSKSSQSGDDCVTIKYSSAGTQLWVKRYDGPAHKDDAGFGIVRDNLGNIYVTGNAEVSGESSNYLLLKYNSSGYQQWVKLYNGSYSGSDKAWGIVVDHFNNIYITGEAKQTSSKYDIVTRKYSSSGDVLWTSSFNGADNKDDKGYGIVVDNANGNCYVFGTTKTIGHGLDFVTIKYQSSNGETLWSRTFDGVGHNDDIPYSMALTHSETDPHIFVVGTTRTGNSQQSEDIEVISYSSTGDLVYSNTINGSANIDDAAFGITVDADDNFYISGYTGETNGLNSLLTSYGIITVKYEKIYPTGIIHTSNNIPDGFKLYQNYPNPFNPETSIKFDIKTASLVKLSVYDISGKEAGVLIDKQMSPGSYEVNLNAASLSSGIYFYKISAGNFSEVKKMSLVK